MLYTHINMYHTLPLWQVVHVITELFSENPDLYEQVAVISFFPRILYKVLNACLIVVILVYVQVSKNH